MLKLYLRWQLKYLKVATRFGLLAEVCLAFLLFPILRGLALFRLLGIQFEASVRYHIWLGTAMIFFATFHGASTLFVWGVSHYIQEEVNPSPFFIWNISIIWFSVQCKLCCIILVLALFSFADLFGAIHSITDMGMAENRADIPCWGDLSGHRVSDLDHITSSTKEKTV